MPFRVCSKMCATCIFTDRSIVSPERFEELKAEWESRSVVQQCHHATIIGLDTGCRGHFEAFCRGETVNHPISKIAHEMGLGDLPPDQLARIYIDMGLITFEVLPE